MRVIASAANRAAIRKRAGAVRIETAVRKRADAVRIETAVRKRAGAVRIETVVRKALTQSGSRLQLANALEQ